MSHLSFIECGRNIPLQSYIQMIQGMTHWVINSTLAMRSYLSRLLSEKET